MMEKIIELANQNIRRLLYPKTEIEKEANAAITRFAKEHSIPRLPFNVKTWMYIHNTSSVPLCKECGKSEVRIDTSQKIVDYQTQTPFRKYCSNACQALGRKASLNLDAVGAVLKETNSVEATAKRFGVSPTAIRNRIREGVLYNPKDRYLGITEDALRELYVDQKMSGKEIASYFGVSVNHIYHKLFSEYNIPKHRQIDEAAHALLYDREWLANEAKTKSFEQIAKEQNVSLTLPGKIASQYGIESSALSISYGETEIADYIASKGFNVVRNTRHLGFELDVFVPELNIAFEYNGVYWHGERNGRGRDYHINKTNVCAEHGIDLYHIWDRWWLDNKEACLSVIDSRLGLCQRIFARKCKVVELDTSAAKSFLNKTHLNGYAAATTKLGLVYNGEVVAVATFGKARYLRDESYELIRFACAHSTTVVGGLSRLVKHYVRETNPSSLISYADKMISTGRGYTSAGFEHIRDTAPGFWYAKGGEVYHRSSFMKKVLPEKLSDYNENLSASENMAANGFDVIWDCGNSVYRYAS